MSVVSLSDASDALIRVLAEVESVIIGKHSQLTLILAGIVAGGHVLLEDLPGVGKTLTANAFAGALGLEFRRAQFTPDLLPSDLTGSSVFDQASGRFEFRRGPVFAGLLLADEVNRTPPKTQAALLEAMQEQQVSVDGVTHALPAPFHVIATANPIEHEGTYPLPEAQLDRFLLRLSLGYPDAEQEWEIVDTQLSAGRAVSDVAPVLNAEQLLGIQRAARKVHVDAAVGRYAVALVRATRHKAECLAGASPRGSLALALTARAWAMVQGRDFVVPSDVKHVAVPALAHRITLRPELWLSDTTAADIIDQVLDEVPVPDVTGAPRQADTMPRR